LSAFGANQTMTDQRWTLSRDGPATAAAQAPRDAQRMPAPPSRCLTSTLQAASVTPEPMGKLSFKADG
jgi:hypothetical protein